MDCLAVVGNRFAYFFPNTDGVAVLPLLFVEVRQGAKGRQIVRILTANLVPASTKPGESVPSARRTKPASFGF